MIRVVIAEDHTLVREALLRLLVASGKVQVVAQATNGREAVELVTRYQPDVLLLDIGMPEKDGLQTCMELAASGTATRVLILSMHTEESYAVRAIRAGAAGFIAKTAHLDELTAAIEAVHAGQRVLPPGAEAALVSDDAAGPAKVLSQREFQVMGYLASGMTNREIAQLLAISVKTVDTHRGHVLKKLKLRNNSDITRFAIQHGLIQG
ncbi:MAG: response regulator transcription factor [Deltaproteobacteria bacterium]|nr:response regulator transcription factor [Deltaproteobacteria bacterium]